MAEKKKKWVQKVVKDMEKKGTVGSFTAKANKAGMPVQQYADKVIATYKGKKGLSKDHLHLLRQAVLAKNFGKMNR